MRLRTRMTELGQTPFSVAKAVGARIETVIVIRQFNDMGMTVPENYKPVLIAIDNYLNAVEDLKEENYD